MWATEGDAELYLGAKPGASGWFDPAVDRAAYLTAAGRLIAFHPDYLIPQTPDPEELDRLKNAQSDLAFEFFRNPEREMRENLRNQGVKKFKFSRWAEEFFARGEGEDRPEFPQLVGYFLEPFRLKDTPIVNLRRPKESLN